MTDIKENEITDEIYDFTDEKIKYKINKLLYLRNCIILKKCFFPNLKWDKTQLTYSEIFKKIQDNIVSEQVIEIDLNYITTISNILDQYKPNIRKCLLKLCDSNNTEFADDETYSDIKTLDDLMLILQILNNPPKGFKIHHDYILSFKR
jgi:hypothetical protein